LGDSSGDVDLYIEDPTSSSEIRGNQFTSSWTSCGKNGNVYVESGPGTINGLHFLGHRAYGCAGTFGFAVKGAQNFTLDSSTICNSGGTQVSIYGDTSGSAVRNNTIGSCDILNPPTVAVGISLTQTSGNYVGIITGNTFQNVTTPIVYAPSSGNNTSAVISDNIGLDNAPWPTIASAATITAPPNKNLYISGTTTITTINGAWAGREAYFIPSTGAVQFSTGGNICSAINAAQGTTVLARYDGGSGCWRIK
jgi:hypothetical protein